MRPLNRTYLLFSRPCRPSLLFSASPSVCSYSLVPQTSCRAYFTQLAEADFSIFSSSLSYKRSVLLTNAKACLVSPRGNVYLIQKRVVPTEYPLSFRA